MISELETIDTKFGIATLTNKGYYMITSSKEGNRCKLVHRLVWEDFYGKDIPNGHTMHHLNGNKLDNRIQNLQCVKDSEHRRFHKKGKNHHNAKYTIWDNTYINYQKTHMCKSGKEPKPLKCFQLKHKGKKIPIGLFNEWISIDIINDFIEEEVN